MRWEDITLLLLDNRVRFLLVFVFFAILLATLLTLLEFRLKRKKKLLEKRRKEDSFFDKIKKQFNRLRSPEEKLGYLDSVSKKYFHEIYKYSLEISYSDLIEKFKNQSEKKFLMFCEEMFKTYYSLRDLTDLRVLQLLNLFFSAVKEKKDQQELIIDSSFLEKTFDLLKSYNEKFFGIFSRFFIFIKKLLSRNSLTNLRVEDSYKKNSIPLNPVKVKNENKDLSPNSSSLFKLKTSFSNEKKDKSRVSNWRKKDYKIPLLKKNILRDIEVMKKEKHKGMEPSPLLLVPLNKKEGSLERSNKLVVSERINERKEKVRNLLDKRKERELSKYRRDIYSREEELKKKIFRLEESLDNESSKSLNFNDKSGPFFDETLRGFYDEILEIEKQIGEAPLFLAKYRNSFIEGDCLQDFISGRKLPFFSSIKNSKGLSEQDYYILLKTADSRINPLLKKFYEFLIKKLEDSSSDKKRKIKFLLNKYSLELNVLNKYNSRGELMPLVWGPIRKKEILLKSLYSLNFILSGK